MSTSEPDPEPAREPFEVAPLIGDGAPGATLEMPPERRTPVPAVEVPLTTAPSALPVPTRPLLGATVQRSALNTAAALPRSEVSSGTPKPAARPAVRADLTQPSTVVQRSLATVPAADPVPAITSEPALMTASSSLGAPPVGATAPRFSADVVIVQRVADAVPPQAEAVDSEAQGPVAGSATVAGSPTVAGSAPVAAPRAPSGPELDDLARRLYERITTRLKAELRLDRERAGLT